MNLQVEVRFEGPLFDGTAESVMAEFIPDAERAIGEMGQKEILSRLGAVLKNPSGYYESRIVTDRSGDGQVINDSGVVYGPWLEGVGSRNATSRFKGYKTFRQARDNIEQRSGDVAEDLFHSKYLSRLT